MELVSTVFLRELVVNFKLVWNRSSSCSNFLISHRRWALLLWGIWAVYNFCWCCYWNWNNCCCLPLVDGPTDSGLHQLSQGCSHWETLVSSWSAPSFVFLKKSLGPWGAKGNHFLGSCRHVRGLLLIWVSWVASPTNRESPLG